VVATPRKYYGNKYRVLTFRKAAATWRLQRGNEYPSLVVGLGAAKR
jgi:hypothetical protein